MGDRVSGAKAPMDCSWQGEYHVAGPLDNDLDADSLSTDLSWVDE